MSLLIKILRSAHCRSTHHYFAIDALERVETAMGQRLSMMLLKYYDQYLQGAKAPDRKFKDFQNHVLHVNDNYWGGAPVAAEQWLVTAIDQLNDRDWKQAAFSIGVLSHYFTDPLMPLHTAQSDAESVVHRPMEWSICLSYPELYAEVQHRQPVQAFPLASGSKWLSKTITACATVASRQYDPLIRSYDLERGTQNPQQGLTADSRQILVQLIDLALSGWSQVLTRIADEAPSDIPRFKLSLPAVLAAIDIPLHWVLKKIENAGQRKAVARIWDEYQRTGQVVRNLPPEQQCVAEARRRNPHLRLAIPQPSSAASASSEDKPAVSQASPDESQAAERHSNSRISNSRISDSLDASRPNASNHGGRASELPQPATELASDSHHQPPGDPSQPMSSDAVHLASLPNVTAESGNSEGDRGSVNRGSPLVDAPSIGPKTAARFERIGITTIGGFLTADTSTMVQQLSTRWITHKLLEEWKAQAALVCDVPALCGYKSQLLVGVDCFDAQRLAASSPTELQNSIARFCVTSEGERILRSSRVPSVHDVRTWIASAQQFLRERQAA